ncbi:hypothetical protein LIER_15326 [Lithospermum erythrorhizon]|uniref:SWIM-type domain-containing protein n=1 Tax=Lithospermum erythrorhizon TaxID=34254 RepID=A0AAV3Q2T5_LITER
MKAASGCLPMKSDKTHFQVFSRSIANQCVVDLEKRCCTCRKWQLTGIPCKHACASIRPWPKTGREGPTPPPMNKRKAGRTKHLRRINAIEAKDNGKTKYCKVMKYLCRVCREPGHNSKGCKKKMEHNIRKSEPVQDEQVQNELVHNATQESRVNAPSSQPTTQSDVTQEAQTGRPPISTFARQHVRPPTTGITIRAPPPLFGSVYEIPFKPPTRAAMRPPTMFFYQGKKVCKDERS